MNNLQLRKNALRIIQAALAAADPYEAVRRNLCVDGGRLLAGRAKYRLDRFRDIVVLGAGKASAPMAQAIESLLSKRIRAGSINTKYGHGAKLRRIEVTECGHPVPDDNGVLGTRRLVDLAKRAGRNDLVLCLISGGASALTPLPAEPLTLADKQRATELLLACGADIHEINAVRKHLSAFKGGQVARMASQATVLSLILSDVIGDDLDVIGSGPTVPDRSTFSDALAVFEKYRLLRKVPSRVRARLELGRDGRIPETPKPGDQVFRRVRNMIVGSNRLAIAAAAELARELGFRTLILSSSIEGESREVARVHAAILKEALASGNPAKPPACLISGGETTVSLRGSGLGGRNQEFVLAAAVGMAGLSRVVILSVGTDGTDGPTDAAGAIADGETIARANVLGMDARQYLDANDSYHFFEALGDLVQTGPTRTNVMDVRLMLAG